MNLLYIFDRWVSRVVIDLEFQEVSIKWHETSFFLVVYWVYCIYLIDECQRVVIDFAFPEISLKRLETTFFDVVACIYCVYLIDESL